MLPPRPLPEDHLERVYAGVIGKCVGVYLGRPFEGWPREKILSDLGHVRYYVHHKAESPLLKAGTKPLVVTDDDVTATFVFVRALEEHGAKVVSSEEVGKTWLNNTVENRSVFWWGGKGLSTEHTAYLNLKHGMQGGQSGSIEANGKVVAEQIGGEIFIDAFAMCAPGNPDLAAQLANSAASVSHDGEGVYGAISWAAMEAEAFLSNDVDHLIDTGLSYIPEYCLIAQSTADIRAWAKVDGNWEITRDRIEEKYGYHKFKGACHIIPNHSIKILSLIYGGRSIDEGLHIIVTCGWDTDSNGGNVGALLGIMHGLDGFTTGPDWRGPLADRVINSSADGGYSINNCARIAYDITNLGRKLAGELPLPAPKEGAQYHFTLPGSVQGFQVQSNAHLPPPIKLCQGTTDSNIPVLLMQLQSGISVANDPIEIETDTYMPEEMLENNHYHLMACPLIYPGQKITANVGVDNVSDQVIIGLQLKHYTADNKLKSIKGPSCTLSGVSSQALEWTIPDTLDHQPIRNIGLVISTPSTKRVLGTAYLNYLKYTGSPNTTFARPTTSSPWRNSEFEPWRRAWIDNTSTFPPYLPNFYISSSKGEGGIFQGCRDWYDYRVTVPVFFSNNFDSSGIVVRYQGLRRWYGFLFRPGGKVAIVKALDEERVVLGEREIEWVLAEEYAVAVEVKGNRIRGFVDGELMLEVEDSSFESGGIGMLVTDGSACADRFVVEPLE